MMYRIYETAIATLRDYITTEYKLHETFETEKFDQFKQANQFSFLINFNEEMLRSCYIAQDETENYFIKINEKYYRTYYNSISSYSVIEKINEQFQDLCLKLLLIYTLQISTL